MSRKSVDRIDDLSTDDVDNIALPFIRTAYDGSNIAASDASILHFDPDKEPSMTKQSFVDECDINSILNTFQKTGMITHENTRAPRYFDCTTVPEYQDSLNIVIDAHESFSSLPAKIRERFHNDPQKLLAFVADEQNYDEAVRLGLIEPPAPPQEPVEAPTAPPAGGDPQRPQGASGGASPASA